MIHYGKGLMNIYITKLNNLGGTETIAQGRVARIAYDLGYKEMGLSFYYLQPDFIKEIGHRLDGIIAPLYYGDVVIFQYPSWIGPNYDFCFADKIKSYANTKLIIFVQDIQYLMFGSEKMVLDWEISTLNKADVLILPSSGIYEFLRKNGLKQKEVIYQTIWDMPSNTCFADHTCKRQFLFTGNFKRFPFLESYHGKTPIIHFDYERPARPDDASYKWHGYLETEKLMYELSKGGFGLVWSDEEYFQRYYSMNQPYKLGTDLAAGIPVVVRKGCVHEEFIMKNGIGFAVDSLEEADEIIQGISDEEYRKLYDNVRNIQRLLLDGAYTRKALQDAVIKALENACSPVEVKRHTGLGINVITNEETLDYILENKCSVARFGDGEFDIISGKSIPYQSHDENLSRELRQIVSKQSDSAFLSCLPDVFDNTERYNDACKNFWKGHLERYKELYQEICKADWYGSTFLSRPYIDLADKSAAAGYFEKLRTLWANQDILIVEGETTRSGVGNDLFANARSVSRIICPSRDAYTFIGDIENEIRAYGKNKLILLMLGPAAKVIAYHLYREGYWLIDMGHIDSEYEWYRMGATAKVKFSNKHTAEHNFDQDICLEENPEYNSQIVSKIQHRSV